MQVEACREGFFLVLVIFLFYPVQADMVHPVKTHVFFQKDGAPYNDRVIYTFKCYGTHFNPALPVDSNISVIYQYSATCSEYGCAVWQPDTHYWQYRYDHCELSGETLGRNFTIMNISPYTSCKEVPTILFYPRDPWNSTEPYLWTPEAAACERHGVDISTTFPAPRISFQTCDPKQDWQCMELFNCTPPVKILSSSKIQIQNTDLDSTSYRHYLDTCDPRVDQNCPGWIVDGIPLKMIPSCKVNTSPLPRSIDPCWRYLVKVNETIVLPEEEWRKHLYQIDEGVEMCNINWTIPPEESTLQYTVESQPQNSSKVKSPVESLYCSILRFLGGRCE